MTQPKPLRAAILDIGSNSIKFMLGHQDGGLLTVCREEAHTTRLGHQLAVTGKLSPASIQNTLRILRACQKQATAFGAHKMVAIGTSALRSATNRRAVLDPARAILGTPIRVISGKREGELVYAGTTSFDQWRKKPVLVIDVGGGSVEFVYGHNGSVQLTKSLPLGCVRMRDSLLPTQPADPQTLADAIETLRSRMSQGFARFQDLDCTVLGSGGTMVTLAALHQPGRKAVDLRALEGVTLRRSDVKARLEKLATTPLELLQRNPRIPPKRADVITAGCCVFYAALLALDAKTIHCTTRGLRYGVWQKMLAPQPYHAVRYEI